MRSFSTVIMLTLSLNSFAETYCGGVSIIEAKDASGTRAIAIGHSQQRFRIKDEMLAEMFKYAFLNRKRVCFTTDAQNKLIVSISGVGP